MDFASVAARLPEDASLETRIKMLRQAAGEDFRVYDFNEYDGLEGALDEDSVNELNDETFGVDADSVGRDFDFGGPQANEKTESKQPAKAAPHKPAPSAWDQPKMPGLGSNFNALDCDPLLGSQILDTAPSQAFDHPSQHIQRQPPQVTQPQPVKQALTLEEIEGDMRVASEAQRPTDSSATPLTIEEIEAQMFMQQARPHQQTENVQPPHIVQGLRQPPPGIPEIPDPHASQHVPRGSEHLFNNQFLHGNQIEEQPKLSAPEMQSMVTTFYPPVPTSDAPSIPPPVPFISTQQRLASMRLEASQLRMLRDSDSIERLRILEAQIEEQEKIEERRRRKGKKIAEMAKYNGLMSQSDKDFITRIQVSQLVKSVSPDRPYDPYADDFYFHVFSALRASRSGGSAAMPGQQRLGQNGVEKPKANSEKGTIVKPDRRLTRRENAMVRMAQQVQRIVDDAKKRQGPVNLTIEGALGRKAARVGSTPRQTIQVNVNKGTDISENLPLPSDNTSSQNHGPPLSRHEALLQTEYVYEIVLEIEQMRRTQPQTNGDSNQANDKSPEELEKEKEEEKLKVEEWEAQFRSKLSSLWESIQINVPLDYSVPHPFIAILSSSKGKKLLPRVVRHADSHITLTILTLLLATLDSLDIVKKSPILDANPSPNSLAGSERSQIENDTDTFLKSTFPVLMTTIGTIPLRIVSGMVGLILKRTDPVFIAKSRPGIALLTVLLARAESLKQDNEGTSEEEFNQWSQIFAALFATLSGSLVSLFPSQRMQNNAGVPRSDIDQEDASIWQFLAALAVSASATEQQSLISELREKILSEVSAARLPTCPSEVSSMKLANVNFLLQSLGLDASLIT